MKAKILIVDDEIDALELMEELFKKNGYKTYTATNGVKALSLLRKFEPDILISDMVMPEMDGMALLELVRKEYPDIAVMMITAHGTIETAVEAMKKGAKDYILKPLRFDEIVSKVETIAQLKSLIRENQHLHQELRRTYGFDNIIGRNTAMINLFETIKDVAQTSSTVLIRGENGTGKELIAKAIHYHSDRANKPLITVNCGILDEHLLHSELFGHVRGAFTGAIKDKVGKFELADGGTLFLDEIGEISLALQVKLLRAIQELKFEPLGGNETIKVDVRILTATNRNLEKALEENTFRHDLFYRLNVIPIMVPPLSERQDDIPLLVAHFIEKFSRKFNRDVRGIEDDALSMLQRYSWPGNIRELENLIERAIVLGKTPMIGCRDFPLQQMQKTGNGVLHIDTIPSDMSLTGMVDDYERRLIEKALSENDHNKQRTAEKLGIHRSTFMSKIKKHRLK